MRCTTFKAMQRNTLKGFATLEMKGGLILHDCTVHSKDDKRWVSPPGRPMLDRQGDVVRKDGKTQYAQVISFASDAARDLWCTEALRCIDEFLRSQSGR